MKIDIGDKVKVVFSESFIDFEGIITHIPCGAGDLWEVEDENGVPMLMNPYCSYFANFTLIEKAKGF